MKGIILVVLTMFSLSAVVQAKGNETTAANVAISPASSESSDVPVKKSKTGICHKPGSTYYSRTKSFTPFKTLDECLKSGGRLPKK